MDHIDLIRHHIFPSDEDTMRQHRSAFTLIELLVVIAIIAILIGLLVPAVQKVRDAANRAQCQNNVKQLALACHNYENVNRVLPPWAVGTLSENGSAHFLLLPYVEQESLFRQANGNSFNVRTAAVPTFACPSDPTAVSGAVHRPGGQLSV